MPYARNTKEQEITSFYRTCPATSFNSPAHEDVKS